MTRDRAARADLLGRAFDRRRQVTAISGSRRRHGCRARQCRADRRHRRDRYAARPRLPADAARADDADDHPRADLLGRRRAVRHPARRDRRDRPRERRLGRRRARRQCAPVARIRGERVPVVVELDKLLGVAELHRSGAGRSSSSSARRAASAMRCSVDSVQDHEELVVKPAAPAIMATANLCGHDAARQRPADAADQPRRRRADRRA